MPPAPGSWTLQQPIEDVKAISASIPGQIVCGSKPTASCCSSMAVDTRISVQVASCVLLLLWSLALPPGCDAQNYVRAEDCTWEPMLSNSLVGGGGVSMTCSVRTLQGGPNATNFSLIMPGHTVQLTIRCTEDLHQYQSSLQKSELANSSFEHLRGLYSLSIERCKLDRLPPRVFQGLADLKHLAVKTFNIEWGQRATLRIPPATFDSLESIESLDLSENNIESLPHALLCGLSQLRFVNLTSNSFSDVLNTGFSSESRCGPLIRELEVAHNKLKVLSERGFDSLVYLQELRLNHNQIARAEPGALAGLAQLERLDMAHNMLVALPSALFQRTLKLSELYLRNNSLSALPPGLFTGLNELTMLDLAHNQLSSLGWLGQDGPLVDTPTKLRVLDLSHNRLTRLDFSAFRTLGSLETLQLQHNLVEFISDNTFAALEVLQLLVLSNNRLKTVGPHMLAGLSSVLTLQLDHNRLDTIHNDALKDITMLQELNLAGNKLTIVPRVVSALKMLRSLDLSDNDIHDVANASYQGLSQLYALNLMGNMIGNITQGAFNDLPSVRILNLARNRIQAIEQGAFDDVPDLHYLRLDSNVIEDVNGLFSSLHDLIMLNISVNRVRWFDYALIPVGLQWLDIHDNQIEALGNYFELEQSLKLRTLDASFNKLTDLDSSSLPNGIEIVYFKNNNLKRIQPFAFLGKQNLTRVDLTKNKLQVLEMTTFRLSEVSSRRPLPEFAIADNPYQCNCHMEWLQRLQNTLTIGSGPNSGLNANTSNDESRQYPRVIDLHSIECQLSFSKNVRVLPLLKVKSSQFLCEYKSHCFSLCHCCDFDACDCEMVCPDNCTCYHDQSWGTNIVDCSDRQHRDTPRQLPMDVSEVYLDGNDIPALTPHSFIGRKNMKVLFINNSNVATIQNRTFGGLPDLRVLRLENNQILALHGREFDGLKKLKELYLSNNHLKYVNNVTFMHLKNLEILHLDRNYLVEIAVWSLQYNPHLTEVRLAGNPWTCDCHYTHSLAEFLHERGDTVRDIFQLSCLFNETTALPLWELNVTDCHSPSQATTLVRQFQFRRVEDFLPILVVVGAVFLLCLVIIIALVAYRRQMSVWFFSHYGVRMFHRAPAEEEKLFDAFVSYTKKDEAFVAQILAPELECGNPPYRLCLHYRDLPMAGGYLSEAIQEAVESSRRTIVVLSEHFLKSEWCRYEFKSAHHEVLNNSNHKLVVIFFGRVSYRELDPDIRMWLKHSTFLHWGEKNFWDKLRYSMPDARHRKVTRSDVTTVAVHI
ncbi:toll-like receptor Tollo [Varroa jacobsoni]|uniref:TIR domain-containing protein n=1 Tax=Varroa destructor TaxID=109461 RepID=A0A7M7JG36_VARDE|nr:toll-like receptor Tollo [Varroa destructor]XP_022709984.1 toll-like receptor Tollo [Varroa jacobsoni]